MQNREVSGTVEVDGIELGEDERQPCEVWTRVMGYYRPVEMYNTGKKGEFRERVEFVEPVIQ
jgi:anaerobic ribonucleoside-triphosphate reductase